MTNINDEKLLNFVETTKKIIAKNPRMNESNTKTKVIEPLLELLGWDIKFDVELEYSIKVGSQTTHADYVLEIDGKPSVLVEAKGFDTNIDFTDDFAGQVISYGTIEGIKWVALTNGKSLHIYDLDKDNPPKDPKICEVAKIDINNFIKEKEKLELISKQSIIREKELNLEKIQKSSIKQSQQSMHKKQQKSEEWINKNVHIEIGSYYLDLPLGLIVVVILFLAIILILI